MKARMPRSRTVGGLLVTGTLTVGLALPAAAGPGAPVAVAPKPRAVLALDSQPTFKVRDGSAAARRYKVWIRISTTKKRTRKGELRETEVGTFAQMKRKGKVHRYTAPDLDFDTWFMDRAGTYYWQAYRIDCAASKSCRVFTKIRSFKVQ